MKNNFAITVSALLALVTVILVASEIIDAGQNKLQVVTTLFPLYDMAKYIGGEKADVTLLLPPGVEPHSFEPRPSDIVKINEADVFIFTGKFMEPWADDITKSADNKNLVIVDASQGTLMIPAMFHDADEPLGALDPHIWLDFDNARIMVSNIAKALGNKDPFDKDFYEQRAQEYKIGLAQLDSSYRAALSACEKKDIVYGGHYAFGYMARRYGLKYLAAQGVSPDAEPTANDLARLVDQIKQDKIKYVFYEELTSPKIAQTIAEETNAKLLPLNAAHNITKDQLEKGITFFEILTEDLNNLKIGLECH
jgi:zinc transport system substrate-binding protein